MGWQRGAGELSKVTPKSGHTQLMVWDPGAGDDQGQTWVREARKNKEQPTSVLPKGFTETVTAS